MERVSYDDSGFNDLAILHVFRYRFASQFVKGKNVLDVGCGEGFGSRLLSKSAESVVGCDLSIRAIDLCKAKVSPKQVEFLLCDGTKLPFLNGGFDVVTALEVIEHIRNPRALLSEICYVLRKDGVCVVSTPRRVVLGLPLNPYHLREFSYEEFADVLSSSFESVEIIGQNVLNLRWRIIHKVAPFIPARIRRVMRRIYSLSNPVSVSQQTVSLDGSQTSDAVFVNGPLSQKAEYFIAVCRHPKDTSI